MKKIIFIITLSITVSNFAYCQDSATINNGTAEKNEKYWQKWITNLYELGIEKTKDSLKISDDVKHIITDSNYRKLIYLKDYTLPAFVDMLNKDQTKIAMWYLINIYGTQKEKQNFLMDIVIQFEQGLEMDKVLISTFYTYAMLDPEVGTLKNGKIEIIRPDLLEQKFNTVKEMIAHIISNRKNENTNAAKVIGKDKSEVLRKMGTGNAQQN